MKRNRGSNGEMNLSRLIGGLGKGGLAARNAARNRLLTHTYNEFKRRTDRMLAHSPALRDWVERSDVLHNSMVRLIRALAKAKRKPKSEEHFLRLGTLQIRRELIDLARRYFGRGRSSELHSPSKPRRGSARPLTPGRLADDSPGDGIDSPSGMAEWTEFHEAVAHLDDELFDVFLMLWYQEMTQQAAAKDLGVHVRTVKRRWLDARRILANQLPRLTPKKANGRGHVRRTAGRSSENSDER